MVDYHVTIYVALFPQASLPAVLWKFVSNRQALDILWTSRVPLIITVHIIVDHVMLYHLQH
jgi:hypothetical protein